MISLLSVVNVCFCQPKPGRRLESRRAEFKARSSPPAVKVGIELAAAAFIVAPIVQVNSLCLIPLLTSPSALEAKFSATLRWCSTALPPRIAPSQASSLSPRTRITLPGPSRAPLQRSSLTVPALPVARPSSACPTPASRLPKSSRCSFRSRSSPPAYIPRPSRSEEHTSELQSLRHL